MHEKASDMDGTRQESTDGTTAHPPAVTRYLLDPDQNGPFDADLLTTGARILAACLDSPDRASRLSHGFSVWEHHAEIENPYDRHLPTIYASASMRQTATKTTLNLTRGAAPDIAFRFEHHEDDPERSVAINQSSDCSLASIRRHQEAIDELVRQFAADAVPERPGDAIAATARAFALVEAIRPIHCGLPVWYSAPWRFGVSRLSQHISTHALPTATRWWRHGNVTLVSDTATQGRSGRTFVFRPLSAVSPLDAHPLEQMRLINLAEDNR